MLVLALIVAALVGTPFSAGPRAVLAALAAIAMGLQNAVARRLAVPDLTTTVLTMTLTGLADVRSSGWTRAAVTRVAAVVAMLGGATVGTLLVLHVSPQAALALAVGILAVITAAATRTARSGSVAD